MDLYNKYQSYSNTELLLIVRQPSKHGAADLVVVKDILSGRTVTEEDQVAADKYILEHQRNSVQPKPVLDFSLYETDPELEKQGKKDMNVILCLMGLVFAGILCGVVASLWEARDCGPCMGHVLLRYSFSLVITLALGLLMYYRKRWGWILTFGYCLLQIGSYSTTLLKAATTTSVRSAYVYVATAFIITNIITLVFMCRDSIRAHLGFTTAQRTKYIVRTVMVTAFLTFCMIYVSFS